MAAPTVQVWADNELFFDYNYSRTPQQLTFPSNTVNLEKNMPSCAFNSIAIFKIYSNIDGFTAILLDLDGDGAYSTSGSDRVIYRDMRKGNNYIVWNFKTDAGAEVPVGTYKASATFLGRGPTHFPVYDVEQLDGVQTTAVRPFKKLNASIYWDDTFISRWGDETGGGLMDETQRKNLVVNQTVPRTWSWNAALEDENFNGNINTMNTWFNAIDLGYSQITLNVSQSATKCVDGLQPYVGDIYKEGLPNNNITFTQLDFTKKFFDPIEDPLNRIRVLSLPENGTLRLSGVAVTVGQSITLANLPNLTFTPTTNWIGRTSFDYEARNNSGKWSVNSDKVYLTVNTTPTISAIADQNLCTNTPSPAIPFTVGDGSETPAGNLTVTAYSADPTFVPNSSIVLGGSGTNRTIQVTPVANKSGNAIIYVMVDDGLSQAIQEFAVYISPDLEFSGDTTLCVGQPLYLVAQETGASSYTWKYGSTTMGTAKTLSLAAGSYAGNWSLTIQKGTCNSTRVFQVLISPITTFTGDADVCVGEEIALSAVENNATYTWKKGTTTVSTAKQFYKSSAALADAGTNYNLTVSKEGCTATSPNFTISVVNQPNIGLALTGSTVNPGSNGTITVASAQNGVTYNVYKDGAFVTSGVGAGTNLNITVPSANLVIGSNLFEVRASNGNCEIPMSNTVTITVREPGITVSAISGNTTEGGGTATFTVVLKTQPSASVVIPISSSDLTEGIVSAPSLTFTTENWNSAQQVTVTGVNDFIIDGDITYSIVIGSSSSADSYYDGIDPADLSLANTDNDIAEVIVNASSGLETTEAGGTATFTVRLACRPTADVTFTLSSSNTAEGNVSPTSVTITPDEWNSDKLITITGADDLIDDGDVAYTINTSLTVSDDPLFNDLAVADVNLKNINNDVAGVILSTTGELTTYESGTTATFTIVLNSQPTQQVSIALSSSNTDEGSVLPPNIVFNPSEWNIPQEITITGVDDEVDDGNISYTIITSKASSTDTRYGNMDVDDVAVINNDDDEAGITVTPTSDLTTSETGDKATFYVKLNSKPTADVTIALSSSNSNEGTVSSALLTFTSENWKTLQPVEVTGVNDFVDDGNQNYTIITENTSSLDTKYSDKVVDDISLTNIDNDEVGIIVDPIAGLTTTESGGKAYFSIKLNSQPTASATIGLSSDNTAEGTVSPASLTFTTENWGTTQSVEVTGVDDAIEDGPVTYTVITALATSDDPLYRIDPADVSLTNNDNDVAGITVTPLVLTTTEGAGSATFSIVLNTQPTHDVTISLLSSNTSEGTISQPSVKFTPGDWGVPKEITVTPVDDQVDEDDVTYKIETGNASSSDPNYDNRVVDDVSVTNRDNDTAGFIFSQTSGLVTSEDGGIATFTVRLATKPLSDVSFTLTSSNTNEGTISTESITFSPANWGEEITITVTGVDDLIDDDDVPYSIETGNATSFDSKYTGMNVPEVSVTNTDNDVAGITVDPVVNLETTEAGGVASFNVKLNTEPIADVTIAISSNNTNEGTVLPASLKFTPLKWNEWQPVTITGVDDNIDDDDVDYKIITGNTVSTDSKYSGKSVPDVSVTNTDDDDAGFTLSKTSGLITTEGGGSDSFTIKLNTRPTADVIVSFTSNNTSEGIVTPASITFNSSNWDSPQPVTLTGVNDNVDDDDVEYSIITSPAVSADSKYDGMNPADVAVTNQDDDIAGFTISPLVGLKTSEAGGVATFNVRLKTRPIYDVTLGLSSSKPTEGSVSPVLLTFTPSDWDVDQPVTVTGVDDYIDDNDQEYIVITAPASSSDGKYDKIDPSDVTVTNTDNDVAGVIVNPLSGLYTTEAGGTAKFFVRLSSKPLTDVIITVESTKPLEGIPTPSVLTFEADKWDVLQEITVTGQNDDLDDDDVAYSIVKQSVVSTDPLYSDIALLSVSLINRDDDNAGYIFSATEVNYLESDAPANVLVSLRSRPTSDVQIDLVSGNTSKGTVSPANLTFAPALWNVSQEITITPVDNSIMDGNVMFSITTSIPTTTDTKYSTLNPPDISVTALDNDVAGITVSAISNNTREDGTTATFTVVLTSEPTSDVTIALTSSNTDEGTVSPASLVFIPSEWNIPQPVTVTGVDDLVADGNQTYSIVLDPAVSLDPNYSGKNPDDVTVINVDLDQAGLNIFPVAGLETNEAGKTATFTISLNTIPASDVKVNFASSDPGEGSVSPASHTFNSTNWNSNQTITLTGADDNDPDGDQPFTIQVSVDASCVEPNYSVLGAESVSAKNNDDITPRPVDDNSTTDEKTAITIDVLDNDFGLDKGVQSVSIQTQPTNGKVVVEADNRLTYTPNGLFNGIETFTYRVTDNNGAYANATVSITVTFVNDLPVAVNDSRGTSINTPVIVDVLFNDYGLEDGGIVVSISENADLSKGSAVQNADNTVTFTPATGYLGEATFKYKVTDANADEAEATVTINVRTVNHLPNAVDDNVSTVVNTSCNINVLANDSGLDDGFKNLAIHVQPNNGSVIVNSNRTLTYTPNSGFIGVDNFKYRIQDIDGDYDIATVTVNVTPKPDYLPVARDDSRGTSFNTPVTVDVLSNDSGLEDGVKEVSVIAFPVNGVAVVNADFSITYTPNDGFIGTEVFGYQVCDNDGDCSSANVTIAVKEGINIVPAAVNDKDSTYINTPKTINVLANDTGLDDGIKSLKISIDPEFGSAVVNANRTVTYTPSYMFIGSVTFKYRVEDIDGDYSEAVVEVLVKERPDFKPVANDDRRGCSFNESALVDVLFNDTGLDDVPLVVSVSQAPGRGIASVNANNTITFTPEPGFVGIMTFRYTVTDADGDSDDALVTINVKEGINYVPVAVNDNATTIVNQSVEINVLANDSGFNDGFGNIDIHKQPAFGTVSVNSNRTITYTPSNMFIGVETFQYYIEDLDGDKSVATVTVTVTERPDYQPVANDDWRGCSFNTPVVVDVLFNDTGLDDTPITLTITQDPAQGTAQVNADGTVTYTPLLNFVGIASFNYKVTDADGDNDDAMVTISVKSGTNNTPTAVDDDATTMVNKAVDINVLANDSGLDDGFGKLGIHKHPTFGAVVVNANRTIKYTPSNMFIGTETFQYVVEDADGDKSVATVTVTVTERPDYQPVANNDSRGCSFNQPVVVDVLFNDTGLDDAPVNVSIKTNPSQGDAVVNPDNTVTYTPATSFVGILEFEYTVTDADGDSDDAKVTINVKAGINYVPVAVDDNASTLINKPVDISVLANDSGLDDGFNNLSIHKYPLFGTVTVNPNRTVTYTPSYMFVGIETFQYMVEDTDGDKAIATVTVNVLDRPDYKPEANDDRRGCSFNSSVLVDVLFNDTGLDDVPITVSINQMPTQGTVMVNPDGTITYTAAPGFIGKVTFRYTVTDADADADDALVTINVKSGENILPKAYDDNASTYINRAVDINVLANDTGLDDGFEILSIHTAPKFGTVVVNTNRTITYTPSYLFIGVETFQYYIQDMDGDYSVATVTVAVIERPNSTPIANDDYRGATYNTPRVIDVLVNDTGLDDAPVAVLSLSNPAYGSVVVNTDNTITYTPDGVYLGTVQFDYSVTDSDGDSDAATVYVNVKVKNDVPDAVDDVATTLVNTPVDIHVLDNDLSLHEGIKGLRIHVAPKWGTAIVNSNNTVTYTPSSWYVGIDEFVYYVEDVDGDYDIAVVRITVLDRQNATPVANDDRRATSKNTPVDIDVLINDDGLDDGWIRVFIDENPTTTAGSVVVKADNTITFTPSTDYLGEAKFKYFITDRDNDTSNVATVTVAVKEVNYVPVANPDTVAIEMNTSILIDVVANDTGLDDGLDYIKLMSKPLHGYAYVFDDRNIKYFPSSWFVGVDSLTYMVVDSDGDYGIAKVIIKIESRIDHKPKANPDFRGTSKNQSVNVDVLFNDTGLEDGGIELIIANMPLHGSVVLESNNTVTYTPNTDYIGQDVFNYQLCDMDNDCSLASVTISVKDVNNVPFAVNDTVETYKNRAIVVPVLLNDLNLHDGGLIVTVHSIPAHGVATVNPDNSVTYTPQPDFFGIDSVRYMVADIDGDYSLAKVVIEVLNRENAIPDAQPDNVETFVDTEVLIDVLDNDLYLIDGVKAVEMVLLPLNGNCTIEPDNKIRYTPMNGFKGDDSFTYRVCDIDNDCDEAVVSIAVIPDESKKIDIPEAFSPNGDRVNDTFEIVNLINFGRVTLRVYNRWGNLVYKSNAYKNDWDGTSNASMALGSKLPDGTYYYVVEITKTGKIYKGSVFIKR